MTLSWEPSLDLKLAWILVSQTPINNVIKTFVRLISAIDIFMRVIFFIMVMGYSWIEAVIFFIGGIIIANVPEGFLITMTVTLTPLTVKRFPELPGEEPGWEELGKIVCLWSNSD